MAYEIVMPQLSDSMQEGKLIRWNVTTGEHVKSGDVIAEVESDKAIMEIQSFKKGVIKSLKLKEGEAAPVGALIAEIETEDEKTPESEAVQKQEAVIPVSPAEEKNPAEKKPTLSQTDIARTKQETPDLPLQTHTKASPKAKALAAKYAVDIEQLQQENRLPKVVHAEDILQTMKRRFFTPKALHLIDTYHLNYDLFETGKKHSEAEIKAYIETHGIPRPKPLSSNQKAVIATVTEAVKKPVFHLYDTLDATLLKTHANHTHTLTVWLLKLFAKAMMSHDALRTTLGKNGLQCWPSASISIAIADGEDLYMPVLAKAEMKSLDEIAEALGTLKKNIKAKKLLPEQMTGSTFGLSNLGMTGITRFDAMINGNDSGIAAIGAMVDGKIAVTLTLDHRILNGYQASRFMHTLKTLATDPMFFKGE